MIDIVVPYYNDHDEDWKKVCKGCMKNEGSNDRQVTGEERYRDWDCFKYWFRCVEENCKWVNNVFLIVATETQIPEWLNTTHPKLKIIYHRDYIPRELLPTFNTMTIELFLSRIEALSDNYIYCNDDYYFLNPIDPTTFFVDDKPVYPNNKKPLIKFRDELLQGSDGTFYKVLNNGMDLQLSFIGKNAHWYDLGHLPIPHKKNFEKNIIDVYYGAFIKANKSSRFRHKDNFSNHVFVCLYRDTYNYDLYDTYKNSKYVTLKSDVNFDDYVNCDMVCFNDTEQLDDYEITKKKMIEFFEKKFPNKSSFER